MKHRIVIFPRIIIKREMYSGRRMLSRQETQIKTNVMAEFGFQGFNYGRFSRKLLIEIHRAKVIVRAEKIAPTIFFRVSD